MQKLQKKRMHYQQMLRKYLLMQTQVKQKRMQWLNVSKTSWRKLLHQLDHATQLTTASKPAVAPATAQAAANASQEATTNARKAAKELPNTGNSRLYCSYGSSRRKCITWSWYSRSVVVKKTKKLNGRLFDKHQMINRIFKV